MSDKYPTNVEVHRWAQAQPWGHKVPDNGWTNSPTFRHVIAAWDKAHPHRPYVRAQAYHGTPSGYTSRGCRCRPCTDAATAGYAQRKRNRAAT